jgi:drug/metabolite transporter (DMT)-like permease
MVTNLLILWPITIMLNPLALSPQILAIFAVSAAFAPFGGRFLNFLSIEKVGVSVYTSISGLQPLIVTGLATIFLAEKLSPIVYAGIVITVFGAVIVGREKNPLRNKTYRKRDLVYPIAATICYAVSNILRKEGLRIQSEPFLAAALTSTFATLYMSSSLVFANKIRETKASSAGLVYSIASGVATSLAWVFSYQALDMGNASVVSTILATQPIIAVGLCYLFMRETEPMTRNKVIGAIVVVLGVSMISLIK